MEKWDWKKRERSKNEQSTKTHACTYTNISCIHDIIIKPTTLYNNQKKEKTVKDNNTQLSLFETGDFKSLIPRLRTL